MRSRPCEFDSRAIRAGSVFTQLTPAPLEQAAVLQRRNQTRRFIDPKRGRFSMLEFSMEARPPDPFEEMTGSLHDPKMRPEGLQFWVTRA